MPLCVPGGVRRSVGECAGNFAECVTGARMSAPTQPRRKPVAVASAQAVAGVQIRFATDFTGEQYVTRRAWEDASLDRCPLHPGGGCGFRRHTAYERKNPPGAKVARYYCPKGRETFSLLPDCLASRYPAQLCELEDVVAKAEQAESREKAVADLWPLVGLACALRKLRRWVGAVTTTLVLARGLMPELGETAASVVAMRERLGTNTVLVALREKLAARLHALPPPVGFGPRTTARPLRRGELQHETGPDPPK